MAGESKTTTDRETIRHWAEERGGAPRECAGRETTTTTSRSSIRTTRLTASSSSGNE